MTFKIAQNTPLAPLTTFKIGGPAAYYTEPRDLNDIRSALQWAKERELPILYLGKGSNLLISDHGFPGLVIHLTRSFRQIQIQGNRVRCQAGALLHQVVTQTVQHQLAGIENLAGIPGTLGGGAYINAGAFDQELGQVITRVTSLTEEGEIVERSQKECHFSYRHSLLMDRAEIIVEVELELTPAPDVDLKNQMGTILQRRKSKQPTELPNAGSMFKRPPGHFAGALIEASGLKGFQVGQAQISPKHANFVVNLGGATAQDVWQLTELVIHKVFSDHQITLEREVIFLGSFD